VLCILLGASKTVMLPVLVYVLGVLYAGLSNLSILSVFFMLVLLPFVQS